MEKIIYLAYKGKIYEVPVEKETEGRYTLKDTENPVGRRLVNKKDLNVPSFPGSLLMTVFGECRDEVVEIYNHTIGNKLSQMEKEANLLKDMLLPRG